MYHNNELCEIVEGPRGCNTVLEFGVNPLSVCMEVGSKVLVSGLDHLDARENAH